jgi:hypothetical protein
VWVLVRGDRKLLSPARSALGVPGAALVGPLLELVERGEEREGGDEDGDGAAVAVDNSDEALLLLKALSHQDPTVAARLKGSLGAPKAAAARGGGCVVM